MSLSEISSKHDAKLFQLYMENIQLLLEDEVSVLLTKIKDLC